jgi:serine/threonine protein phosphatase 1
VNEIREPVKKFPRNVLGKDFVVGDIHGEFWLLEGALERIEFNVEQDRLFSVGDLIDRGRDSIVALDWLAKPWFFSILGNHEAMALEAQNNPIVYQSWTALNGGEWWLFADDSLRKRMLDAFAGLPVAMEIEAEDGKVGIVHAEVPAQLPWDVFISELETGNQRLQDAAVWSRTRITSGDDTLVEGIDRVFCGHTPVEHPVELGNVFYIDTGACYGRGLTIMSLDGTLECILSVAEQRAEQETTF